MWIKNCWYVAGFAQDVGHKLLARKFLNQAVILWRTSQNELVAMEDRCPHRLLPLSIGELVQDEDQIQCGYHGLRFNAQGACTHVPGQDALPRARVKLFPVAERHALVWIWLGTPELADADLIPDLHWLDAPGWTPTTGYHHMKADYRLLTDNLLDLSHETYVHRETIGNAAVADAPVVTSVDSGLVVRAHREMPNIDPPPFFALMLNHTGKIDRWQIAVYMPPGINMTDVGAYPVGTDREKAAIFRVLHLLTPETEHSTHYFWAVCRNFRLDDTALGAGLTKAIVHTFDEDQRILEIQDRCLQAEGMPQVPQAAVKVDIAPMQGRRILNDVIKREQDDPRFCVRPIALADDARVAQPPRVAAE
jgi:vanillate O-demethylase monooxygenase subunit